jgi:hypothetical protein
MQHGANRTACSVPAGVVERAVGSLGKKRAGQFFFSSSSPSSAFLEKKVP